MHNSLHVSPSVILPTIQKTMMSLRFRGRDITPEQKLKIAIQNYHYVNFDAFMGIPLEEVKRKMKHRMVATSVQNIVEEYFSTNMNLDAHVEGRIVILD